MLLLFLLSSTAAALTLSIRQPSTSSTSSTSQTRTTISTVTSSRTSSSSSSSSSSPSSTIPSRTSSSTVTSSSTRSRFTISTTPSSSSSRANGLPISASTGPQRSSSSSLKSSSVPTNSSTRPTSIATIFTDDIYTTNYTSSRNFTITSLDLPVPSTTLSTVTVQTLASEASSATPTASPEIPLLARPTSTSSTSSARTLNAAEAAASASAELKNPALGRFDVVEGLPFLIPSNVTASWKPRATSRPNSCGQAAMYANHTWEDWNRYNVDGWLNNWIQSHQADIVQHVSGFVGAFVEWATGNPDISCQDDGSSTSCNIDVCQLSSNSLSPTEMRVAYYVLRSIKNLRSYFSGLHDAYTTSSITAALARDGFTSTFYQDKDVQDLTVARESMTAASTFSFFIACLAGFGTRNVNIGTNILMVMAAGGISAIGPTLGQHSDQTYKVGGALGMELARMFIQSIQSLTSANNALMSGRKYRNSSDIRDFLRNGAYLDFTGIDKNLVTNEMNNLLIAQSINGLWRKQKVYIMGGGACGDNEGLGSGPQNNMVCRDGKAWYLYWWQEQQGFTLGPHVWGWTEAPPGAHELGAGMYAGISVQDVINSSLDTYIHVGYNYSTHSVLDRAAATFNSTLFDPAHTGPSLEGTFTIPVCDIGKMKNKSLWGHQYLLTPYGGDNRPMWCGPICNNSPELTKEFIRAANMENFQSPTYQCEYDAWRQGHYQYCDKYYGN